VAVLNNRADFGRAESKHWYRIPKMTVPDGVEKIRWIAFSLTQSFEREEWSVRHWAKVEGFERKQRIELVRNETPHPRARDWDHRVKLGRLQPRHEPILSRRRSRIIVFNRSIWMKFQTALEINDFAHGSPLENRLWAALKLERIEAERQWWEGDKKTYYCLAVAVFCPERNLDDVCDGELWHSNPQRAANDNGRNNSLEHRG